jgi:hypothetical protein
VQFPPRQRAPGQPGRRRELGRCVTATARDDLRTPEDGFAWTNGLESDPVPLTSIYETTNSGRTWHAFTPKLTA